MKKKGRKGRPTEKRADSRLIGHFLAHMDEVDELCRAFLAGMCEDDPEPVLRALQEGRMDPETVYQQYTLLQIACTRNLVSLVRALLLLGVDVNKRSQVRLFRVTTTYVNLHPQENAALCPSSVRQ